MKYDLDVNKFEIQNIYIKSIIEEKTYYIGYSLISSILDDNLYYDKLKQDLLNKDISIITIFNKEEKILEINKILFLKGIISYLNINSDLTKKNELLSIYQELNYKFNINRDLIYELCIDNQKYTFNVEDYFTFLELEEEIYNEVLNSSYYKGVKIEYFIYSLINYFKEFNLFSKYTFNEQIQKRFLSFLKYEKVDCEALNQILITKDNLLNKITVSKDIQDVLNIKYDEDILKNIIKCYIRLCQIFNYDEIFYIDELNIEAIKHLDYNYISKITRKNNKLVCFEFTSIFGYFLNNLGIKYEVVSRSDYGTHSYLIFRYQNYLIKVEAINSVFENDLTNVRIRFPILGIECINQNESTKRKFDSIKDECYKALNVSFEEDYLPANKINNSYNSGLNNYLLKIDLIFKKNKDLDLSVIDKLSYFKKLIKLVFTSRELELNVFYTTLSNGGDLIFVFALNSISFQNMDNVYIVYENNNLSIIKKDELKDKIKNGEYEYLTSKEIPGISGLKK